MEGKGAGLIAVMLLSLVAPAQFSKSRQVTFRAHATLSPGFLLSEGGGLINAVGDAEYFLSNQASVRFDVSYYLLSIGAPTVDMNHGLYVGMCFRPTLRSFAPFAGFQPGLHLSRLAPINEVEQPLQFVPVISGIAGFNWYFTGFLHASAGVRLLHGNTYEAFNTNGNRAVSLTELRAWLGLGFHVQTKRRKFDDR
jgi:hypothetical protein